MRPAQVFATIALALALASSGVRAQDAKLGLQGPG